MICLQVCGAVRGRRVFAAGDFPAAEIRRRAVCKPGKRECGCTARQCSTAGNCWNWPRGHVEKVRRGEWKAGWRNPGGRLCPAIPGGCRAGRYGVSLRAFPNRQTTGRRMDLTHVLKKRTGRMEVLPVPNLLVTRLQPPGHSRPDLVFIAGKQESLPLYWSKPVGHFDCRPKASVRQSHYRHCAARCG